VNSIYGTPIELNTCQPHLNGSLLMINGRTQEDDKHDRFKQHGFHFNADNCIACHACESACSEKNDLPPHLSFRKVGTIEGGSYPAVTRINISMACNHCEDPVCLKGCPTRAYTKYLEYGAVLQDPETCFGCGYCTWVCPYNAPQLDPVKGQVSKCNMCIDRLEIGLQPSCVDACLGKALEFGVVEQIPEGQEEAKPTLPGFPDPTISRPNIRFQQTRFLPESLNRIDAEPIQYQKVNGNGHFQVNAKGRQNGNTWGWDKLRSREDPLVFFTLVSQFAVGAFLMLFLLPCLSETAATFLLPQAYAATHTGFLVGVFSLLTAGLISSTLHLGKPRYFYRAFNNLRHSWVSREIAALGAFFNLFGAYILVSTFPVLTAWLPGTVVTVLPSLLGWSASVVGLIGIYCMYRCYRIKARPFWDHWHTGARFFGSGLVLASGGIGLIFGLAGFIEGNPIAALLALLAWPLVAGILIEAVACYAHRHYLESRSEEAAVSLRRLLETFGKCDRLLIASLGPVLSLAFFFTVSPVGGGWGLFIWANIFLGALLREVVSRAIFYVLVVPTTIPGGYFLGNRAFESHARKSGLADQSQVGVASEKH